MKKRYILFVLIVILSLPSILINNLNLLIILVLAYTLYFIRRVERTAQQDGELTQSEKIQVIITEILNPLVAGAFYYYCWKNKFPKKASQANLYSWIIVGIDLIVVILLKYLGIISLF